MNFLKKIAAKIAALFSPKNMAAVESAINSAVALVPKAIPIVEQIAAFTPNKTDDEIAAAFAHYAEDFEIAWLNTPNKGGLLLTLATKVLAKQFPNWATNVLNTAIQLAVTATKAKA